MIRAANPIPLVTKWPIPCQVQGRGGQWRLRPGSPSPGSATSRPAAGPSLAPTSLISRGAHPRLRAERPVEADGKGDHHQRRSG